LIQIVEKKVKDLIPDARNSRTHSESQVAQIAGSIKEFGFTNPVLIDGDSGIIAGHGRVIEARIIEMDTVPCIVLDHLSEIQKRAYIIADNKLALNAGWDQELLKVELDELMKLDFAMEAIGFSSEELVGFFDINAPTDPTAQSYTEIFNVVVECSNEDEQEKVYVELTKKGYKCQVQSL